MKRTQVRAISKSTLISNGSVSKELIYESGERAVEKTSAVWGKTKMPRSFQVFIPKYSISKGRFPLEGLSDERLQELVKACRFKYERGPRQGEYITEAYYTDEEDPFFRHSKLFIQLTEGDGDVRDNPVDEIMYAHLITRPEFRLPDSNMKMAGVSQQYEFIDKEFDQRNKEEEDERILDATELLLNADDEKKSKIMTILGMRNDGNLGSKRLKSILLSYINESADNVKQFREVCNLSNDKLNLKYYIQNAIDNNLITQPLSGIYMYNGEVRLGRELEEVELFLLDPENKDILQELMSKKKK